MRILSEFIQEDTKILIVQIGKSEELYTKKKKRSKDQNAYFWELLQQLCEEMNLNVIEEYKKRVKELGICRQWQLKNKSDLEKLKYNLELHKELHDLYCLITKMVIVCIRKKIPLIIENPYSSEHYLTRYWCLKPGVIDTDRTMRGDHYKKPTQYWFINREPSNNFIFEPLIINEHKLVHHTRNKVERSLISKEYANRFIREFIL